MSATTTSVTDINAAIIGYLPQLDEEQKAAVLSVVKAFAPPQDHWDDPSFVAEMDRRYEEYRSGKVKAVSLEDLKASSAAAIEEVRKKKSANEARSPSYGRAGIFAVNNLVRE